MSSTEVTLALISTIAAAVSAVGGLLATFAAFRSAGLTKTALAEAAALERRRTCDAVTERAQRVIAEHARLVALMERMKEENRNFASLTGNTMGSWLGQKLQDIDANRQRLEPIERRAANLVSDYKKLLTLSEDDLADLFSKLFIDLSSLQITKEDFRDQLNNVRAQNQLYRGEGLSGIPRAGGIGT